jgi:hypothetical protein
MRLSHPDRWLNIRRRYATWFALLVLLAALLPAARLAPVAHAADSPFGYPTFLSGTRGCDNIVLGDFDGDGMLDLVCATEGLSQVYRNTGAGDFAAPISLLDSDKEFTRAVAVGDLNGDGAIDIVLGKDGNLSQVYLNTGAGGFANPFELRGSGRALSSVAIGDLNGDGKLDIILGNTGKRSQFYLNTGASDPAQLFAGPADLPGSGRFTTSVALGDLNGDGKLDVVLGNRGGNTDSSGRIIPELSQVYLNTGNPANLFGTPADLPSSNRFAASVALGDLNGDGKLDVVLGDDGTSQVYLNTGAGSFANPLDVLGSRSTNSVALGDLNGDGKLDLVLGNTLPSQVYLNAGVGGFGNPFTTAPLDLRDSGPFTFSAALGDLNGDGKLDIVLGNNGTFSQKYLNTGAGGFTAPLDLPGGIAATFGVVTGDLNGDGKLDLVLGTQGSTSRVYLNTGARGSANPFTAAPFKLPNGDNAPVIPALGDLNGDGKLDVVLGNSVYLNRNQGSFANPFTDTPFKLPNSDSDGAPVAPALGDLNGDGTLDIALGDQVYLNTGARGFGNPFTAAPFSLPDGVATPSNVALGDLNGDGKLDIVLGNRNGSSQVYQNTGASDFAHSFVHTFDMGDSDSTTESVAVGDLNGDGALDIVLGNGGSPSQVYLNDGAGGFPTALDLFGSRATSSVALGDLNGDGALDIALGNSGGPLGAVRDNSGTSQIYLNNGTGGFATPLDLLGSGGRFTAGLALGDLNGDGALDITLGNAGEHVNGNISQLFLNGMGFRKGLPNNPPTLAVGRPGPTANANFYATPAILDSRVIAIPFMLADPESDQVSEVRAEYSLNGGGQWIPAIAASGTITANLGTSPAGTLYTYNWDTFASGFFGQSDNVVVRLVGILNGRRIIAGSDLPLQGHQIFLPLVSAPLSGRGLVAGPYQQATVAAMSFPFRVRGTQVRVISGNQPQAGAQVYRIHGVQPLGGGPIANLDGAPFTTNAQGYLGGFGEIDIGDQLVALQPVFISDTYTLYHTSAAPTPSGLNAYTVQSSGVQTLTVSADNPLVLFHLKLSLEWDARSDPQFLSQLQFDLRRASELLYDWSNGQAALGDVTVYQGRQQWSDADVRVYATNRLRPNADVGGLDHAGDHIRIGAIWTRYGDPGGTLGEDWPRALAHELGHYAFGLDDNYLGLDNQGRLIPVESCPGVMSDPYRDDQSEFRAPADWLPDCQATLANNETNRSDWANIVQVFPALKQPDAKTFAPANAGPNSLPLAVTQVHVVEPATPNATLAAPIFYLTQGGARVLPGNSARAFLFMCADGQVVNGVCQNDQWSNLVDLGSPTLGQVLARGAHVGDRLCVYELAASRLGCQTISAGATSLSLAAGWQPDITITPQSSTAITVSVAFTNTLLVGQVVRAQLYPADGAASAVTTLKGTNNEYAATLTLGQPTLAGQIHIWVDGAEPRPEAVVDYGLSGSGARLSKHGAPVLSPDGQVTLYTPGKILQAGQFYTLQAATHISTPPPWATVLGQAYRLTSTGANLSGSSLNFSYLGSEVPPGEERWVTVYYCPLSCPDDGSGWQPLPTSRDTALNQAITATQPGQEAGLYVLMSSVEIPLSAGDNVVAYPVHTSRSVAEATASIAAASPQVSSYNVQSGNWQPLGANALLEYGKGYKITVAQALTWRLKGDGAGPTGNALAAASAAPGRGSIAYTGEVLGDASWAPAPGRPVVAWIDGQRCGQGGTLSDGQRMVYIAYVVAESQVPGCGATGRIVHFTIDHHLLADTQIWGT